MVLGSGLLVFNVRILVIELCYHLLLIFFQVLCVGPTGTGKTLTLSNKLLKNMPSEYISHFLMFSARTSANQTQDYIDSKLDKRFDSSLLYRSVILNDIQHECI